ncbi:sugar transporter-like [Holotrichia oblita]|uniref:Sugar transporter-like n=1 Tax=Holotrichia oblita TaxID=644536 RepID=A0ACB9T551_HOLOL|nr:sugar transporter-like [Holotrichia oblita]
MIFPQWCNKRTKLFVSVGVANLTWLVAGMVITWPSPILQQLEESGESNPLGNPITSTQAAWIGSVHLLAATIGSFPFGYLLEKIGRKQTLLLTAAPFIISYIMAAFTSAVGLLFVVRILAGLSVGGAFTVLPTYIAEVSDSTVRGMLGATSVSYLSFGMLLSYILGAYLSMRIFNLLEMIIPILMIILFYFVSETPYYLIEQNNKSEARKVLTHLREDLEVENELKQIEFTVEEYTRTKGTFCDIFKSKKTTKSFIVALILVLSAQLCGIDIVLSLTQNIFESAVTSGDQAIPPIIIGAVQFITSFIAPAIVDRLGRKILLLISAAGVILSETFLGLYFYLQENQNNVENIAWIPLTTLILFIISYNVGLGPVPWTIMGEILPANLSILTAGMTITWTSTMLEKLKSEGDDNSLSSPATLDEQSWIGSLMPLGCIVGPIPFMFLQNKIGKKYSLTLLTIPYIIAYFMAAFAKTVGVFYALRFIAGMSVGAAFAMVPPYVAEISDTAVRGAIGALFGNFITAGMMISFTLGPFLSIKLFNIVEVLFPVIMVALSYFIVESPYYLVANNKMREAEEVLKYLRSKSEKEVQNELTEINDVLANMTQGTLFDIFKTRAGVRSLIISICLVAFGQLCGSNVILFYMQSIFEEAGFSFADKAPIIVGGAQFLASFITPALVEKMGRRVLLLTSATCMLLSQVPLGAYYYLQEHDTNMENLTWLPVVTLMMFVVAYNFGFGTLPLVVASEITPLNLKGVVFPILSAIAFAISFAFAFFYNRLVGAIGVGGTFCLCSVFCVLAIGFTFLLVPETKGKSFQEIERNLESKK